MAIPIDSVGFRIWDQFSRVGALETCDYDEHREFCLLKQLHPVFEKKYGVFVHTISVGTGKALRLGQNGDVDVVARPCEEIGRFVYGARLRCSQKSRHV